MIRARHEDPTKVKAIDMGKLKFGAWIPSYTSNDSERLERVRTSIRKCDKYGIDVWVIDHLLTSPGLYSVSWLEPIETLSYAARRCDEMIESLSLLLARSMRRSRGAITISRMSHSIRDRRGCRRDFVFIQILSQSARHDFRPQHRLQRVGCQPASVRPFQKDRKQTADDRRFPA
jgi:hypothetical protein